MRAPMSTVADACVCATTKNVDMYTQCVCDGQGYPAGECKSRHLRDTNSLGHAAPEQEGGFGHQNRNSKNQNGNRRSSKHQRKNV